MTSTHSRFRFGPYELEVSTLELWKDSEPVTLTLQPSKALALLVENAGTVVTRERFYRHLWPDSTVQLDQGLNTCIRQLRTALDDDADAPVFIETVPRRGYRFMLPAMKVETPEPGADARQKAKVFGVMAVTGVVAALAAGVAVWLARSDGEPPPPVRLAVLPFQAIGAEADEETRLFAEGLSEELVAELAGMAPDRLAIIARTSSSRFADRTKISVREIGSALRADFLLEGSIRPSKDGYRVSARLVDTSSETSLWSHQRNEAFTDPISTQAWLATRVASAIVPRLAATETNELSRREPVPEVRVPWLMALHLLQREHPFEARRSLSLLEVVLDTDPSFARAHAGLARAFMQLDRTEEAEAALERALELEPGLPEGFS